MRLHRDTGLAKRLTLTTLATALFSISGLGGCDTQIVPLEASVMTDLSVAPEAGPAPADLAIPPPIDDLAMLGDGDFYGASRCAAANVLLCEDFESGLPKAPDWTMNLGGGATAVADMTRAARGKQSMHIHAGNFQGTAYMGETRTFPPSEDIWGRAFYYMVPPVPGAHATFFDVAGAVTVDGGAKSTTIWRYGANKGKLFVNFVSTYSKELSVMSATAMPTDRWACFEFQFKAKSHELHFYMDGVEIKDIAIVNNAAWLAPPWMKLDVGWQHYEMDNVAGYDLWVDEVAIDRARVGCSR